MVPATASRWTKDQVDPYRWPAGSMSWVPSTSWWDRAHNARWRTMWTHWSLQACQAAQGSQPTGGPAVGPQMVLLTMTAVVKKWRANPSGSHWGHFMGMLVQIQSLAILWHYISSHGHSTRVPRGIAETLNLPMQSLYCCHLLAFNHPYMLPHVLIPIYLDIIASVWFSWSVLNHLITNWFVQAGDQWKYHCELNCPDDLWQLFLLSLWNNIFCISIQSRYNGKHGSSLWCHIYLCCLAMWAEGWNIIIYLFCFVHTILIYSCGFHSGMSNDE